MKKNKIASSMKVIIIASITMFTSGMAYGYSHNYINMTRSSVGSKLFISQSIEGEYGKYIMDGKEVNGESVEPASNWKGSGIKTSFGLESMKFLQFSAGHTFVNVKNQDDGLENITGSKLNAEMKLVFLSPIGNLELGAGGTTAKFDYRRAEAMSEFSGSGSYFSVGVNYFFSSKISTFANFKAESNNYVRSGGSATVKKITAETNHVGAGFTIWI